VSLYERSGTLRGEANGPWTLGETVGDRHRVFQFENPYAQLATAREELAGLMQRTPLESGVIAGSVASVGQAGESDTVRVPLSGAPAFHPALADVDAASITGIALFTRPLQEISIGDLSVDRSFAVMSLEDATARTMFHMPNLLRAIDRQRVVYSNADLNAYAEMLDQVALARITDSPLSADEMLLTPAAASNNGIGRIARTSSGRSAKGRWWLVLGIVLAAIVLIFVIRSLTESSATPPPATTAPPAPAAHPLSEIVIKLPSEIQLFVSPSVYPSRAAFDRALELGEGQRYLPSTEQVLVLDSMTFAKGVYGYFRVENAWRKGKLLQTFQTQDTITIDNFLPPLP